MNWYSGNIAEAVQVSKTRKAIFVVYVDSTDELSQKLRGFIDDERIKSILEGKNFVAIRIEGGSTAYTQFAQIYKLVPLPSLFFIGENGKPLEIVTGLISSVDELSKKISNVLKLVGINEEKDVSPNISSAVSNDQENASGGVNTDTPVPSSSNIVCEDGVCHKKTDLKEDNKDFNDKSETEDAEKKVNLQNSQSSSVPEDKLDYAKKVIEEKRKEREAEEAKMEREREIKRRKEGQDMQNLKKWQKDQEMKEMMEKIQREKLEEQAARQRILEKIAADKAERAAQKLSSNKLSTGKTDTTETQQISPKPSTSQSSSFTRINFRKQTGESETHNFAPSDTFSCVREFVKNTILNNGKIKEFSLATTFPRREFTSADDTKTLQELDLYPSAVLLIITSTITSGPSAVIARSGGFINIFNTVLWTMLSPVFYLFNYVKGFFTGQEPGNNNNNPRNMSNAGQKRQNEESINVASEVLRKRNIGRFENNEVIDDSTTASTSGAKPKTSKSYRQSNIHRLHQNKDSDDDNNTWNGNSTQQQ